MSEPNTAHLLHASCVYWAGEGLLLQGPSGAGKSDLALRLMEDGGQLVGDDQILVQRRGPALWAKAPDRLRGWLEVRGIGIIAVPYRGEAQLTIVINLLQQMQITRLPESAQQSIFGVTLPQLTLDPNAASAIAKLRWGIRALRDGGIWSHTDDSHDAKR